MMKYAPVLACIGVAMIVAMLTGCGTKDKQQAQQPAADSVTTAVMADSATVPAVFTDTTHVLLRFRVRPGEVYRYRETVTSISEGTFNKVPAKAKEESQYHFSLRMEGMDAAGILHVVMMYDSIAVSLKSDQGERKFSSNDSTQMHDPQYALYNTLIKVALPLSISRSGEIVRIDSLGGIADRILALNPTKQPLPPNARQGLINQLTDGAVKSVAQHVFARFPDSAIAKSAKWGTQFSSMADVFPTEHTIIYTLTGFSANGPVRLATISSVLGVKILQKKVEDSTAVVVLKSSNFSGDATADVDLLHGLMYRKHAVMKFNMEILASGRGAYAQGNGDIKKTMINETILERE